MDEDAPPSMLNSLAKFMKSVPDAALVQECASILACEKPKLRDVLWATHLLNGRKLVLQSHEPPSSLDSWDELVSSLDD